jgi:hypothetical protein
MRAAGYEPQDFESEEVEVWPENWPVLDLFLRLDSQWQIGMAGRTGLRYEALYPLLDRQGLTRDEWDEWFADVRALERAALAAMQES